MIPLDHEVTKDLNGHALGFYGHELWYLASSVKNRCEAIFTATQVPESGHYIKVDAAIHSDIFGVLSQAAGIKKLMLTPSAKSKGESRRAFQLRRFRAHFMAEFLRPLKLSEVLEAKVRNTIEHFDEYLDEAVIQVSDPATRPSPWAAYNMVLSDWGVFNPRVFPVRVYIAAEKVFYNMQWSIDIGKIHVEASSILDLLRSTGKFPEDQNPGGLLVMFQGANNTSGVAGG